MRAVHWFRNDLRLSDNTALIAAARADELIPLFVLDDALLAAHASPPRRRFLLECLTSLAQNLSHRGSRLLVRRGDPAAVIARLLHDTRAERLTFNRDYSPYARRRDAQVERQCAARGVAVESHKDRVVFESDEVRTQSGTPFSVYTPYRNAWLARGRAHDAWRPHRAPKLPPLPGGLSGDPLPTLADLEADADTTQILAGGEAAGLRRLAGFLAGPVRDYVRDRDRPAVDGTSRLSAYLRFGAVSPRRCIADALTCAAEERRAAAGAHKWVDELIWREFYLALLAEHPRLLGQAFKRDFAQVAWNHDADSFAAWCAGRTGFPIVDAAMRQLVASGWMHNRARMVVASFLTKDLLIDWRAGERVFMRHLIDGEPASNNGGWQWAASTGTDAQPYFRIFNPVLQGEKFDPDGTYVRTWIPELADVPDRFIHKPWQAPAPPRRYAAPIVDHAERRIAAVARYEAARRAAGA
jgi:deoxyribodipyrimidine photo-lyase